MRKPRAVPVSVIVLASACFAGTASGSLGLATGTGKGSLQVDARGNARVAWPGDSVVIPPKGLLYHGGSLSGPDVSRKAHVPGLPAVIALRQTPDGTFWALQAIQIGANAPVTLDFSHWQGEPTKLTLTDDGTRLKGTVEFHGKPVTGTTFTNAGKIGKVYVYLDCFGCTGKPAWTQLLGVAPKADGSFSVYLRRGMQGSRYRATVAGRNVGATLAPDAQTEIAAPR